MRMASDLHPIEEWHDPIVAEVRRAREALFAESNYDIHEFCRRLSERQATSGHAVVNRGRTSVEPVERSRRPGSP
jgi:hypothetical protein